MENVSLEMINERLIGLTNAVNDIRVQMKFSNVENIHDEPELKEELNAWNELSIKALEKFESKL